MAVPEARRNQILMEETVSRRAVTRDETMEEEEFRRIIRRQVRRMKRAGVQVVIPNVEPDLTEG